MRTTITIDDHLLEKLKIRAARERTTVSALIEEDVRLGELRREELERPDRPRFRLRTFDLGESNPGLNIDDNAATLEFLESGE